jgi:hypothetical protein
VNQLNRSKRNTAFFGASQESEAPFDYKQKKMNTILKRSNNAAMSIFATANEFANRESNSTA